MVKWLLIVGGVLVLGYLYVQSNAAAAPLAIPGVPGGSPAPQPPMPMPGAIRGKASPGAVATAPTTVIQGGWRGSPPMMTTNQPPPPMINLAASKKALFRNAVKL